MFNNARRPGCDVCHSAHSTQPVTAALLTGTTSVCIKCHQAGSRQAQAGEEMGKIVAGLESAGPASEEALTRVRIAIHTMNLTSVKTAAENPTPAKTEDNK